MAGSHYTATDNTSWGTYAAGKLSYGHAVNMASSTSNEWLITGVQLEVGDKATPFEHRSFGEEEALFSYFQRRSNSSGYSIMGSGGHWVNATTPKVL